MYRFFINRPIVAMVIAILMVLVGAASMVSLPVAQFPSIVPPEIVWCVAVANFLVRMAFRPDAAVSSPRPISNQRGLRMLTAHAPANAVGMAPRQRNPDCFQSMDLCFAKTNVATAPDKM